MLLRAPAAEVASRVESLLDRVGGLEKELEAVAAQRRASMAVELSGKAAPVGGTSLVVSKLTGDGNELRQVALAVRERLGPPAVVVFGSSEGGKGALVALVTTDLVERGVSASELIADAARELGGGGSRDAELAQAGGPHGANLAKALDLARSQAEEALAAL